VRRFSLCWLSLQLIATPTYPIPPSLSTKPQPIDAPSHPISISLDFAKHRQQPVELG